MYRIPIPSKTSTSLFQQMMIHRINFPIFFFFLLSLTLLSINLCGLTSHAATAALHCQEVEIQALLELKQRLDDPSNRLSSWVGKDCCAWKGIRCSNITARVIKLDLRTEHFLQNESLSNFERAKFFLRGDINTPSLLSLEELTHVDLSDNDFSGHTIPTFFGSFARLTYLDLSMASFTGRIPDELGNLSTLRHLDLSYNCYSLDSSYHYSDNCPYVENLGWIARLTSLRHLNMTLVSFRSASNWFQALNALLHIQDVTLRSCELGSFPRSLPHLNFTSLLALDLAGNDINGTEPTWLYNITTLRSLDFSWNDIYWSSMHTSISRLASLRKLDLSKNTISKSFLLSLSNLCELQVLSLNKMPNKDALSNLEKVLSGCLMYTIEKLHLRGNQLNIYFLDWLGNMKNVLDIDLSYNLLTGSIPNSLGSLTSLQYLDLSSNNLNGTVGESIGQLKNLILLELSNNSLSLSLVHLANLSSLKFLDISYNFLFINETDDWIPTFQLQNFYLDSCKIEPRPYFPKWLKSQTNLSTLFLTNTRIEGTFPTFLPSTLQGLSLSNNSFSGHLPPNIGNTLPNLYFLDLSMNNFNGSIPHSLCQIHTFYQLQLSKNNFSGELPNCWNSSLGAIKFDFSNNLFHGEIPNTLCNIQRMHSLYLSYNHLSGRIPLCLQDCRNLVILDAGHNNFIGNIPSWSKNSLPYLKNLKLNSNSLTGNIPELSQLACLQTLDLSNNNLSGSIPQSFGNFNALKSLPKHTNEYFMFFDDKIWLRIKRNEYEYTSLLRLLTFIDLSNNSISGYIPKELGNLHGLQHLNLSKNNLIGEIPWSINGMQDLESLDLSRNSLSGTIPSTLTYLNFLDCLNLSYNNLSGSIPIGMQLQTLDPSIYIGNPYLCGPPLTKECTSDIVKGGLKEKNKDDDGRKETIWLFPSVTLGFIIGFWGIWSTLMLHTRWRILYFCAIDNIFDKLYMQMLVKSEENFGRRLR